MTGGLTVPNLISSARIALIPVFAWTFLVGNDALSFGLFFVIGASDWIDGFVARRTGQVSVLGKLLDPVADRLAIVTLLFLLSFRGTILWQLAAALLLREALVALAFFVMRARGYPRIDVNWVGKISTACIFFGLGFAVMDIAFPHFLNGRVKTISAMFLFVGAPLYWIAGLMYLIEARKVRPART